MDSADKAKNTSGSGSGSATAFQHEWVSKVLEGGNDWQLVCAGPNAGELNIDPSGIDQDKEATAFRNLLNAMYNIPYTLHADEIVALTKVAKLYMALPVVSRSLDRVFGDSSVFIGTEIRNNACQMLCAAAELRHPDLFKDAMIWFLGPFSDPIYPTLEDPKLKILADHMYCRLSADIHSQHYNLIAEATDSKNSTDEVLAMLAKEVTLSKKIRYSHGGKLLIPKLFRHMYEDAKCGGGLGTGNKFVLNNFKWELDCDLSLGSMSIKAGCDFDDCKDYFLSNMLEGDDIPWDSTELDW